jgi:post-segregation antitoxin (ccd killing protein)
MQGVSQRWGRARARGREPNIVDLVIAVEPLRKDRHHEEVDHDCDREADAALDRVVEDRLALRARVRDVDLARLYERGVQEDVVRHYERADDADRDLQLARAARLRRCVSKARQAHACAMC